MISPYNNRDFSIHREWGQHPGTYQIPLVPCEYQGMTLYTMEYHSIKKGDSAI
jgi:hypothetical protein